MPALRQILLSGLLFCCFGNGMAQAVAHNIRVLGNGYRGHLAISGYTDFFFLRGDTTLRVNPDKENSYYLNTGTSIGDCQSPTSYIYLFFNKSGLLDSVCPKASATVGDDKKSIRLNTVAVTINPGRFNRAWYPSFGVKMDVSPGFYYGKRPVTVPLIKGQAYAIDDSHAALVDHCPDTCQGSRDATKATYLPSYFYFTVTRTGRVALYGESGACATASGSKLTFKTVRVNIDPKEISDGDTLCLRQPRAKAITITHKTRLAFIRSVVSYVYWTTPTGEEKHFYFVPL